MKTQKLFGKVIGVALAATLLIGGTTVFAAETIGSGESRTVEIDGYTTKVNYTFRPETDGDYMFVTSDISDDALEPAIRIHRSGKLIGEAEGDSSGCSLTLYGLEAGKSYQIQAIGTGIHMGTDASYTLTITNVTPEQAPDQGMPDYDIIPGNAEVSDIVESTAASVTSAAPAATEAATSTASLVAPADPNASVKNFVERLYINVLGREYDIEGRDYWVDMLLGRGYSGSKVANGFFSSSEFASLNLDDEEYITTLYEVFFGRTPDQAGLDHWVTCLANGMTRSEVLSGFTSSAEWNRTCAFYGINV